MIERDAGGCSEDKHVDAESPLRRELALRKARLSPAQAHQFEERIRGTSDAQIPSGIRRQPAGASKPLSFSQERRWFLEQLDPEDRSHIRPVAVRLTGELNVALLEQSLTEISKRHEVLRATFDNIEGSPQQHLSPVRAIKLHMEDCSGFPVNDRDSGTRAILEESVRGVFDLSSGPILRGTVVRWGMEEHILLLVTHHIVFDAWSSEILIDELFTVYGQLARGSQPELPVLPISYADYACWQRQRFEAGMYDDSLAYWTDILRDLPDRVNLPVDRPRRALQRSEGGCERLRLCPDLVRDLQSLARMERTTLFSVLLAAFAILIQRYAGADYFLIGTPVAGREAIEAEGLIGPFVNTLALRCDLSGDPSARELIHRVHETVLNALEHREAPFEKVVEAIHPERDLQRPPLFDVVFNLENVPQRSASSPGLAIAPYDLDVTAVNMDLIAEIRREAEGALTCEFAYRSHMFDRETIQRALLHYKLLLRSIAENPDQAISCLSMLPAAEQERLLIEWNNTQRSYPEDRSIYDLFEVQAAGRPDRTAVICGDESITYHELAKRASCLAQQLRCLGVQRNVLVGIRLERSIDLPVSILAVLKAGGAYVPFDLAVPQRRVAFMLGDVAAHCLITQRSLDVELSPWEGKRIVLDSGSKTPVHASSAIPATDRSLPDDAACVFYTSGSIGNPKGVLQTHRGVVNYLIGVCATLGVRPDDVILQLPSAGFDASLRDLIGPLIHGACVVLLSEQNAKNPVEMIATMLAQDVSAILTIVPSLLSILVDMISAQRIRVPSLRLVVSSADTYSKDLAEKTVATFGPQVRLYNCYGSTEGTGVSTAYRIANVTQDQTSIPIGCPLPNEKVYVLDRSLRPTGIGVPGELYVAGPGVATEYVNRPELTATHFFQSPFNPGTMLYKTGDLGRWLGNGELEFLGRVDRQIKLRGYRIEPGEIEAILCEHPAVRQAVVAVHEPVPEEHQLVAYVLLRATMTNPVADLRKYLKVRVPHYMIPNQFVLLDELPLTPRGKLDRAGLPHPTDKRPPLDEHLVEPRTPIEVSIAAIWKRILRVDRIGVHDSFFDLGGHSLLAVRLIANIEKAFGVSLPLATLFEYPTVEALSHALEKRNLPLYRSTVVCLQKGDEGPAFFCVPAAASSVNHFAQLIRALSSGIPFYGMQALGLEPGEVPQDRIEDMAARYIADMRAIQPRGPYFIGGRCLGAYIAFEMALQLHEIGEDVALLALLDPTGPPGMKRDLRYYVRRAGYFRHRQQLARAVLRRIRWTFRQVQRLRVLRYLGSQLTRRIQRTYKAHIHAQDTYAPRIYSETITFFASQEEYSPDDSRPLWKNLTSGGFELHLVQGTHRSMSREPHIHTLVKDLEAVIYEARQRSQATARGKRRQS